MTDVIIIGSGLTGSAVARELSKYDGSVLVLERGNDVSVGTSKANSGIIHSGVDAKHGSNKAKYNVAGNAMFDDLARDLDFPFRRNGSLILCFDEASLPELDKLVANGTANGVGQLSVITGDEARALEPNLSSSVVGAVLAGTGGIASPYEFNVALAEHAVINGVQFSFNKCVDSITKTEQGFVVHCSDDSSYTAKVVVNCAGVHADIINNMVCEDKLEIIQRKGEYVLLDKKCASLCDHTLFQLPTAMGKGVLVSPTTHGNIILGPTAQDSNDKDDVSTSVDGLAEVLAKVNLTIPTINRRMIITQFAGLRAHELGNDFVVGQSKVEGFYNVAGIESPGLTAAPAIGEDIAEQIVAQLGLGYKQGWIATRKGIPQFSHMTNSERTKLIDANPLYGKIVCRCEVVTEGEIVAALNSPIPAVDLDGVKRRTRAGMGRCQAGFCTARIMEIIAREHDVTIEDVTKGGSGSEIVVGRTK